MRVVRDCLLAMVLAAGLPSRTGAATGGLTPEAKADFEWFSGLGFPEVKSASLVRVATGRWSHSGPEPPQNSYLLGFLLATNGNRFTTLDLDLSRHTFTNSAAGTAEHQRVGFERIGLKERAATFLDYYEKPRERDVEADLWRRFGERVTERSQVFVLAWACWGQGLEEEAGRLWAVAQKTRKVTGPDDSGLSLRRKLENDLGRAMMWRAVLDSGDPAVSRRELLAQFQAIAKNYPGSEYHARAEATAQRLAKMIAEEEQHAKSPPKPSGELSLEEKVRELIFQLREQNGQQFSQPGECDIFLDRNNATNTAAHQLVNLGYPAVPQLIAALDDPTLTRSVGFHRNFYFSHTVLTVGDCAAFILNRIAGKAFYTPQSTSSYLSKDGNVAQVRQDAETWWAEIQRKGERQTLIDATVAGAAPGQARLLCERYPEAAPAALMRGISASRTPWSRAQELGLLAAFSGPGVEQFLHHELREGPFMEGRVVAAAVLRDRGKPEATEVMIEAWKNYQGRSFDSENGAGLVMQFLAQSDSPAAIDALSRNMFERSAQEQLQLVQNVGGVYGGKNRSPATLNAVEKFLVAALPDAEETGIAGTIEAKSLNGSRICDLAGFYLTKNWPDRYDFDLAASRKVRDRQRLECQNVWRKANHLAELRLPQTQTVQLTPGDANKVMAVEWAEGGVEPDKGFAGQIEALKDKLITAGDVVGILTAYATKPVAGTGGIQLRVRKDEDLTGVTISVRLLAGLAPQRGQNWKSVQQTATLGQKALLGMFGEMFMDYSQEAGRWQELTRAANQAIAGPAATPFFIYVGLAGAAQ